MLVKTCHRVRYLALFALLIHASKQPNKGGRSLLMDPTAQLGLYLFFVGSTMGIKHLHPQSVVELLQQCYLWWCEN